MGYYYTFPYTMSSFPRACVGCPNCPAVQDVHSGECCRDAPEKPGFSYSAYTTPPTVP